MANAHNGATVLDMARASRSLQSIADQDIDWKEYKFREERAKVVPAHQLAEEGMRRMMLGRTQSAVGLSLPWVKAQGKVCMAPGKLIVWAGWQHHGKSNMAKQIMLHAITNNEKVCIASMEEEMHDVWEDLGFMACGSDIPSVREIKRWTEFQKNSLWFYDQQGTVSAQKILLVIRYCAEELGVTQFVVDSLMMLEVARDDYDAQSRFVGQLKALAKDTHCDIHLIAHMRKGERTGGEDRPGDVADIAGGHEIGSKADYVFVVWRDKERKVITNPECVLLVKKQRGRINWLGNIGLDFHPGSRQYIEGKSAMSFWINSPATAVGEVCVEF